jgi:hypothetical protein
MSYLSDEIKWYEELCTPAEYRGAELRNEIEMLRRSAVRGNRAAARLIFRMSKMWSVRCATGRGQRLFEESRRTARDVYAEETAHYKRTGEDVVANIEWLQANPHHPITRSAAGKARLRYAKEADTYQTAQAVKEKQEHDLLMGPPRGSPTPFYFNPVLELKENVAKARKLDLEGWEDLTLSQHCELARRWAVETERLAWVTEGAAA